MNKLPISENTGFIEVEQFVVAEWSPSKKGELAPTQVHLSLEGKNGIGFLLRFKSNDTISRLIHALTEHRDSVFGDREETRPGPISE